MVVKRRNHGRSRKNCGSSGKLVSCDGCGSRVAKDKVRRRRRRRGPRGALFFFCLLGRPGPGGRGGAAGGQAGAARAPRGGPHEARERPCVFPLRARGARRRVGVPLRGAGRCPLRARSPFLGILVPAHDVGEARSRAARGGEPPTAARSVWGRHEPRAGKFPPSPSPARLTAATRERRRDRASLRRCPRV